MSTLPSSVTTTVTTTVSIKYFASIREAIGASSESLTLPQTKPNNEWTVGSLRDHLLAKGEPYATALARGKSLRAAHNQSMCEESVVLRTGDEVAFFPPVTGG